MTVGIITIRLINESIGIEGYGETSFVLALLTGICAIDFGFLQALPRFVARYEDNRYSELRPGFWAASALSGLAILVAQSVLIGGLSVAFHFLDRLNNIALSEVIFLGLTMLIANILAASSAIYSGFQRYGLANMANISRSLAYLATMIVLWKTQQLTIDSVLWANVLTTLTANLVVTVILLLHAGDRITWSWQGFPGAHAVHFRELANFSLYGWLITLTTILVSNVSVVVAGMLFSSADVAKLQIALVLLVGASAFVTGGMTPLTTICARYSDGSDDAEEKRTEAASQLLGETVIFSSAILVFFVAHASPFIQLLLDQGQRDPALVGHLNAIVLSVVLPGIAFLPLYVFRFSLVDRKRNADYGRGIFSVTLLVLVVGIVLAVVSGRSQILGIFIGMAVAMRGVLSYRIGKSVLHRIRPGSILRSILIATVIFAMFSLVANRINIGFRLGELDDSHLHGVIYGLACATVYLLRARLNHWIGIQAGNRAG